MSSRTGRIIKLIDGKERGFSFGMNCWSEFCKLHNIGPDQLGSFDSDSLGLEMIRDILYCAALAWCESNDQPIDFNKFTVGDWIDEMEQKDFQEILSTMTSSRLLGKNLNGSIVKKAKTKAL